MRNLAWHLLAIATVAVWGTSFVSTKVLLGHGFTAVQVFALRFAATWLLLLAMDRGRMRFLGIRDELRLALCGLCGCTLYYWAENSALAISPSGEVSLVVCGNPLLIMLFAGLLWREERLRPRQVLGCAVAFAGMAVVVLDGTFVLGLSPLGGLLAFAAAASWAVYSLAARPLNARLPALLVTRRMFFHGTLSSVPILFAEGGARIPWENFAEPVVALNFLALTLLSSLFGYLVWNKVLRRLGTVLASNYIYAIPLVTVATAAV
ncbi:MAG: DMT family transporter, partial [Fibrobacterales bacterium]|nr:DMT family transporter [Fibrobacterales bacterium]